MKLDDLAWPDEMRERFNSRVDRTGEHWMWTGTIGSYGYGTMCVTVGPHGAPAKAGPLRGRPKLRRKFMMKAHRLSLLLEQGEIPDNLDALHKCDIPACVRPSCLFWGTQSENVKDMDIKKRRRVGVGERHRSHKLTEQQVRDIRRRFGQEHYLSLAKEYGISNQSLYDIAKRKTWRHIA